MDSSILSHAISAAAGAASVGLIWLITDRLALKAKVAALEAKLAPEVKKIEAAATHELSLVEAGPKVALADLEALFSKGVSDIRAEAARIEATKAALVPATTTAPSPAAAPPVAAQ